ncbi:biopolymer transporter ExbD [Tumidithrix elongata RA019]|uniref:Biopolymer transporter ExbD n=1 Tax=Tumidithrix elongata BACA0141 TaxID=2716417 RepID=A0AAW9PVP4_9CYAN|nr:biopolymer transporter ExbD [Tumidithrix elongata RA019]
MKIRSRYSAPSGAEINITALLDVVFSILAFFVMISAGLATPSRVGVDLPVANNSSAASTGADNTQSQQNMLIVTLDNMGRTLVDGNVLDAAALEQVVRLHIAKYPQGLIVMSAEDKNVTYQQVVNRLADLRRIAGDRVAIATSRS